MIGNMRVTSMLAIILCILAAFSSIPIVMANHSFNVEINLADTYKTVIPGSTIYFTINLINLESSERMDVNIHYDILDQYGRVYAGGSKTVAIETQSSFVASLKIPGELKPGKYQLRVEVISNLGDSDSTEEINVSSKINALIYYLAGAALLAVLSGLYISRHFRKIQTRLKVYDIVRQRLKK